MEYLGIWPMIPFLWTPSKTGHQITKRHSEHPRWMHPQHISTIILYMFFVGQLDAISTWHPISNSSYSGIRVFKIREFLGKQVCRQCEAVIAIGCWPQRKNDRRLSQRVQYLPGLHLWRLSNTNMNTLKPARPTTTVWWWPITFLFGVTTFWMTEIDQKTCRKVDDQLSSSATNWL